MTTRDAVEGLTLAEDRSRMLRGCGTNCLTVADPVVRGSRHAATLCPLR